MITCLNVKYQDKDKVKALGARWNYQKKRWFVPDGVDLSLFIQWIPDLPELSDEVAKVLGVETKQPKLVTIKEGKRAFFDGSCEPCNPGGSMGVGSYIEVDGKVIWEHSRKFAALPTNTNNIAEMLAAISVLKKLDELGMEGCNVYGDSQLTVNCCNGRRSKTPHIQRLCDEAVPIARRVKAKFHHIPREQNKQADILSKRD
jgi:ribonuclease HI